MNNQNPIIEQVMATVSNATSALGSVVEQTNNIATVTEAKLGVEKFVPEKYLETFGFLNTFEVFGNTPLSYIFAFLFAFICFLLLPLVWKIFASYFISLFSKLLPDSKELVKTQFKKFNYKIFLIIAIYLGLLTINIPSFVMETFKGIVLLLIGIQIAIIVGPLLEPIIKNIPGLNKPELKPITNRLVAFSKMALWAIVGIFGLTSLGMDTAPLLGSIGVLGIGGALAFQNMMPGFIKVLSFHFSKNFSIGDKIAAGTIQGVVEEIDITTTRLKKTNGDLIEVKNEDLLTAIVIPSDGPHIISDTVKINLSIANENTVFKELENIFINILNSVPDAKFEKVLFTDFKGAGVNVDLNYSVQIEKKIETRHTILTKLLEELKSKNISFTGV